MVYNIYTAKENNREVIFSLMNTLGFNLSVIYNDGECIKVEVKDESTFAYASKNLKEKGLILNYF